MISPQHQVYLPILASASYPRHHISAHTSRPHPTCRLSLCSALAAGRLQKQQMETWRALVVILGLIGVEEFYDGEYNISTKLLEE